MNKPSEGEHFIEGYSTGQTEEAAKAAFRQAQSVYRGEYDYFPLTNTWDNAGEKVRDSWRSIAAAACGARKFDALKLEYAIAEALAPYFEEGFTAIDGAQAVMRLLRDEALSAGGDEAKKSEGGPLNWQLSDDAKARIAEIDANRRHAALNAGNIVAGSPTPSDPTDRREIVARLNTLARYAFNEGFAQGMREETSRRGGKTWDEFGPKYEKAILAALDGGAGA